MVRGYEQMLEPNYVNATGFAGDGIIVCGTKG